MARNLSFTRAAEELNVTPAAVKQLVNKLENTLGVSLIRRDGKSLYLTEAGRLGHANLTDGLSQLSLAVDQMKPEVNRSRLTISSEPCFAAAWLVPRLNQFREIHNNVDVLVDSSLRLVDLDRGDADVAIRYGVADHGHLESFRLFEDKVFLACSPKLVEGPPRLKELADLSRATFLHWDLSDVPWAQSTAEWFSFSNWLNLVGASEVKAAQNLYFSDYNQAVQAAIAGQGVVLGSWPILRDNVDAGLLVTPFNELITTDIGYDLVMTERAQNLPRVEQFKSWLLAEASAQPRWQAMDEIPITAG